MAGIAEPGTGLVFYELSHVWGHGVPALPGYDDVKLYRSSQHARNGVMAHRIRTVMHTGTHLNAPIHLIQKGVGVGDVLMERLFGSGVVVSVPKNKWELVTAVDLEAAKPAIEPGDIVVIVTGWHRKYSDSIEYFGHAPGLAPDAARWLVDREVALVAVDTPQVDHPLATSLGLHRNGPLMKRIPKEYEAATGRAASADFPDWNPAHRALLDAGIPTVENVGGDIDDLLGQRVTLHAYPWYWHEGDACPIRFVGILDPGGTYRLESGAAA
ncbi:MAG TPA: cyclase family protein [Bauldia sp.]|jgi:kynurenine formamidase